jgi:hypothetical protein
MFVEWNVKANKADKVQTKTEIRFRETFIDIKRQSYPCNRP